MYSYSTYKMYQHTHIFVKLKESIYSIQLNIDVTPYFWNYMQTLIYCTYINKTFCFTSQTHLIPTKKSFSWAESYGSGNTFNRHLHRTLNTNSCLFTTDRKTRIGNNGLWKTFSNPARTGKRKKNTYSLHKNSCQGEFTAASKKHDMDDIHQTMWCIMWNTHLNTGTQLGKRMNLSGYRV